jgi:predicted transcriptional regulator
MRSGDKQNVRRGSLEIVADILNASCNGVRKTELISKSNLSFNQFKEYLQLVVGARLIRLEDGGSFVRLKLSKKGREFLADYQRLKKLLE